VICFDENALYFSSDLTISSGPILGVIFTAITDLNPQMLAYLKNTNSIFVCGRPIRDKICALSVHLVGEDRK
jgi:hypothetical protein